MYSLLQCSIVHAKCHMIHIKALNQHIRKRFSFEGNINFVLEGGEKLENTLVRYYITCADAFFREFIIVGYHSRTSLYNGRS